MKNFFRFILFNKTLIIILFLLSLTVVFGLYVKVKNDSNSINKLVNSVLIIQIIAEIILAIQSWGINMQTTYYSITLGFPIVLIEKLLCNNQIKSKKEKNALYVLIISSMIILGLLLITGISSYDYGIKRLTHK